MRVILSDDLPDGAWFTACEAALKALYEIYPDQEKICISILQHMADDAFINRDQDENPPPSRLAAKLFFVVGEVVLNHLVLIEKCAKNVRKVRLETERRAAEASPGSNGKKKEDINSELGVGGVAADAELDAAKDAAEKQIVGFEKNILNPFSKMIARVCRQSTFITAEPTLKASALLAMTKLMVVDANVCEANLQLIFTYLHNKVIEPEIRSNIVIALGDIALRFPNILEPWTEHVYRPLDDADVNVRKTAMMVLTHLILNDMMKVKGHIAKMAACLEDSDERVAALASLFFHELAKKEYKGTSPIYNLLPDMLSVLSKNSSLNKGQFQSIMHQLLAYIKKDKHGDALMEKLCHRFASTEDIVQWRNVSFCMSQLPLSDKGVKKMIEGFGNYKNALADDETAETMLQIVAKVKKGASKPESKELASDLETKISQCIQEWQEINGTGQTVENESELAEDMNRLAIEPEACLDSSEDTSPVEEDVSPSEEKDNQDYHSTPLRKDDLIAVKQENEEATDDLIGAVHALAVE